MFQFFAILTLFGLGYVVRRYVGELRDSDRDIIAVRLEKMLSEKKQTEKRKQAKHESDIETMLEQAARAISNNRIGFAQRKLEQVLDRDENNFVALSTLGAILIKRQSYRMALSVLEKAHKLDPLEPSVLANIGAAYMNMAEYAKAAEALEHSLAIEGGVPKRLINLANIYKEMGKIKKAKNIYQKILTQDKKNSIAKSELAKLESIGE